MDSKSKKIVWLALSGVLLSGLVVFIAWRLVAWSKMGWAGVVFSSASDVDRVLDGSPAAKAGVRPGDHLLYLNGIASNESELLSDIAARARVGDTVIYELKRDSQRLSIPIQLVSLFRMKQFVVNLASVGVVSLAFVGIGVFVYAKKSEDRRAAVFYMLCVTAAASNLVGFAGYIDYSNLQGLMPLRLSFSQTKFLLPVSFASFLFVLLIFHFALIFPKERPIIKRRP